MDKVDTCKAGLESPAFDAFAIVPNDGAVRARGIDATGMIRRAATMSGDV